MKINIDNPDGISETVAESEIVQIYQDTNNDTIEIWLENAVVTLTRLEYHERLGGVYSPQALEYIIDRPDNLKP